MTMLTKRIGLALLLVVAAAPLAAQVRQGPPGAGRGGPPRTAVLRGQIEETFMRRAADELGLTEEQSAKMSRIVLAAGERRRDLEDEQRRLQVALDGQFRPGVAANADSVNRMIDRLGQNRVNYAESFRDEMKELQPILSPVQRGQFLKMRDRLLQRIRELQENRAAPPARP
jgi:Spy/CpxP family protein refolding chaperone